MTSAPRPAPHAPPNREGQTFAHRGSRWLVYANFVKLPHTLFALPFALVGVVLASYHAPVTWPMLGWIVLAFTCARFAAMGFNRIVDREIDARNPRTRQREIPSGALRVAEAMAAVTVASLLFVYAAWRLNPLCAMLSPIALAWVFFYSYTKRFTRWCHLVLGVGMSIAPVGGYLAVAGAWSTPWWMLIALALAVATWGGGFDMLYALQDVEFDRSQRLHSLPAMLGGRNALLVSRVLHVATVCVLAAVGAATFGGAGRRVLRAGRRGRGGAARLRAFARQGGRLLAARRGVLHDERRHQHRVLRLRAGRAAVAP